MKTHTFKLFYFVDQLPASWDEVAESNIFLQTNYLRVLEKSAPTNMQCFYVGIFENNILIGVMLAQFLDLNKLESFGERDKCVKTLIRNFIFKRFGSHTLFIGNNMITGQNGYAFCKPIECKQISEILIEVSRQIGDFFKNKNKKIHLVTFKDFYQDTSTELKKYHFEKMYEFNIQPNMVFYLKLEWKNCNDYVAELSKKYRDQYKRALKKFEGIQIKELTLEEVIVYENRLYELYHYVAKNAPFNTFFLAKNHFSTFKRFCNEHFLIFGYFLNSKLVGFHTVLRNGTVLETYFLGYDAKVQKENMLYLNMLYNMTNYGIENGFEKIIFGRTALEIKSSVGAVPVMMSGFVFHNNKIVNRYLSTIFKQLEPAVEWQVRHPFK